MWLCWDHAIIIRHVFFPPLAQKWQKKGWRTLIDTEKHVLPVQSFHSVYKVNTYFSTLDVRRKPAWLICPPLPHHQCNVGCYQPLNADWLLCSGLPLKLKFFWHLSKKALDAIDRLMLYFSTVAFLRWSTYWVGHFCGSLSVHGNREQLRGLENVTRVWIHKVVSAKWVIYQFLANYILK